MQILLIAILFVILIGFIIYKIDKKFGKKEAFILSAILVTIALAFIFYEENQKDFLPNKFKEEYKKQNGTEILKLSTELLNNKNLSSKKHFIYKFTYIIVKDKKEYLCIANDVKINKIEDEYVFEKWEESCTEK